MWVCVCDSYISPAFVKLDGKLISSPAFTEIRSSPKTVTCDPGAFQILADELVGFLENNFPTEALEFIFFFLFIEITIIIILVIFLFFFHPFLNLLSSFLQNTFRSWRTDF